MVREFLKRYYEEMGVLVMMVEQLERLRGVVGVEGGGGGGDLVGGEGGFEERLENFGGEIEVVSFELLAYSEGLYRLGC
jgi:hypothetical protein